MKSHKIRSYSSRHQKGATLITALAFLVLITIVSISAMRVSIFDILASGNEQQQTLLFQSTENDLKELATVIKLYVPLTEENGAKFADDTGVYQLPTDFQLSNKLEEITDKKTEYNCGGFNGKATSLGPSIAKCYLYDFEVKVRRPNSRATDIHNRGAGKEKPNPKKNSYL